MSLAFKQFRVYFRSAIVLLVAAAVALILIKNRGNEAHVWFFGLTDADRPINVVWLIVCTAGGALVTWWTLWVAWRLMRDLREVKRLRASRDAELRLREREAAVEKREREAAVETREREVGDRPPLPEGQAEEWE